MQMHAKPHEQFIEEAFTHCIDIDITGVYSGATTPIGLKCKKCGHEWSMTPHVILRNGVRKCPVCISKATSDRCRKSPNDFAKQIAQKYPFITLNSPYVTSHQKVNCTCSLCGETYDISAVQLLDRGCKICNMRNLPQRQAMPKDIFIDRIRQIGTDVSILEYHNAHDYVLCKCNICGNEWESAGGSLLSGTGCPKCSLSHGEKKISALFDRMGVVYESQKTFDRLIGVGGRPLSYDFYLPEFNMLIEYQGEYHYGIPKNQTDEQFQRQKQHDALKSQYARDNGMNLLLIPYTDYKNLDEQYLSSKIYTNQNPVTITV